MNMKTKEFPVTVYTLDKNEDGIIKFHYLFTQKQMDTVKKHSVKTNYDGSFVMKNGDLIVITEEKSSSYE